MDSSIDWYDDYFGTDWQSWDEIPERELIESLASITSSSRSKWDNMSRQEIIIKLIARMIEIADEHG